MSTAQKTIEDFTDALDQLMAAMNVPARDQARITRTIADLLDRWDWDGEDSVATALMRSVSAIERARL